MSIGELLVVVIIALLVMKPDDIINVLKNVRKLKNYLSALQKDFFAQFEDVNDKTNNDVLDSLEFEASQLNFYLKKIVDLEGNYDGIYSLPDLKKKYEQLIESDINNPNNTKIISKS